MNEDWLKGINEQVEAEFAAKILRRKKLREKRIDTDPRIVAWIDILGFSQELQAADSNEAYRAVYHKMLDVHEAFAVATASDNPDETNEINENYGRTILALSDGLVIAVSPDCEGGKAMTPYDFCMSFVAELILAQARCAHKGIFLRGGISIGPFHYEDNILLSPALVRAYHLETNWAVNPVIIADMAEIDALKGAPGVECYATDSVPSDSYFQEHHTTYAEQSKSFYHLDYLKFMADPANHDFYSDEDRRDYSDRKNFTAVQRDEIFNRSFEKTAVAAMKNHKKQVLIAYNKTSSNSTRAKYRWLMEYQNRTLEGYPASFDGARFTESEIGGQMDSESNPANS